MVYAASGEHSTEMEEMVKAAGSLPADQQALVLIGLLLGFGAMLPMFPLHGWLPLAQKQAPSPVAILIVGVLLNMGAYGLLRSVEMLPLGAAMLQPWLAGLAVIGVVHGALQACRQTDLRAMVAYLSISQMGVVLLGISSLKQTGFLGAALQMSAHGWVAGGVCLLVGLLALRIQSSEMVEYGSLAQTAPRFAVLMALTLFAAMALPGTLGFIAFFHALLGGWERWGWWTLGLCLGVLLSAVCALRVIVLLFMGGPRSRQVAFADLQGTELVAAVFLGFAVLLLGVVPSPVLHWAQASAEHLGEAVQTYDAAES
jgi:NADH-quinone oxidoreductase subunit M